MYDRTLSKNQGLKPLLNTDFEYQLKQFKGENYTKTKNKIFKQHR